MQVSTEHIIFLVAIITLVFLLAGCFLLLYVDMYNKRKKRHQEEKKEMQKSFEDELTRSQVEVQEQTLKTIASDIHDNVGQLLSLTKITLSTIHTTEDHAKVMQKINSAINLVGTSIKDLRQLATILHAENLLAEGLEYAVEKELAWIGRTDTYQVTWNCLGIQRKLSDPKKELIAFRLIQELLNNIIKHAGASVIELEFEYMETEIRVQVKDNGVGFDIQASRVRPTGLGLNNLFKRAELLGGNLELASDKDRGTTAILRIPIYKELLWKR